MKKDELGNREDFRGVNPQPNPPVNAHQFDGSKMEGNHDEYPKYQAGKFTLKNLQSAHNVREALMGIIQATPHLNTPIPESVIEEVRQRFETFLDEADRMYMGLPPAVSCTSFWNVDPAPPSAKGISFFVTEFIVDSNVAEQVWVPFISVDNITKEYKGWIAILPSEKPALVLDVDKTQNKILLKPFESTVAIRCRRGDLIMLVMRFTGKPDLGNNYSVHTDPTTYGD